MYKVTCFVPVQFLPHIVYQGVYTRKNAQLVTNLQQTCSKADATT